MASIEQQAKGGKQGEVRYLTPLDIETKKEAKRISCIFHQNVILGSLVLDDFLEGIL